MRTSIRTVKGADLLDIDRLPSNHGGDSATVATNACHPQPRHWGVIQALNPSFAAAEE